MSAGDKAMLPILDRVRRQVLLVGIVGVAICLVGGLIPGLHWHIFPAYLIAYLFWIGIALGCASITMLHHLVGGSWGLPVRRPMEAGAMTLPVMALLFTPLLFGMQTLYPWARRAVYESDPAVKHKIWWLNVNGFTFRTAGYFVIWITLAYLLNRWSAAQDRTTDHAPSRRLQAMSGPGLVLFFGTTSLAMIDWVMSLEPDWYSTIYSAMLIVGQALATFASMIVVAAWLARSGSEEMAAAASPGRLQDLGNLLLAFVMLWAYTSFSQFLIIWCGNLAEEIPWYIRRTRGGWQYVALALIVFHFFVPFGFLLFRDTKRGARLLMGVALAIVVMHLVDLTWLVLPAMDPEYPHIPWLDLPLVLVATAGIGGIWATVFLRQLEGKSLVPRNDPGIRPAAEHAAGG